MKSSTAMTFIDEVSVPEQPRFGVVETFRLPRFAGRIVTSAETVLLLDTGSFSSDVALPLKCHSPALAAVAAIVNASEASGAS